METILDFKDLENIPGSQITTDTSKERAVIITSSNRNCYNFEECALVQYYYNNVNHDDGEAINDTHKNKKYLTLTL